MTRTECDQLAALLDEKVTVCAECLTASCWNGEFYCEKYKESGIRDITIRELIALNREHPSHWIT